MYCTNIDLYKRFINNCYMAVHKLPHSGNISHKTFVKGKILLIFCKKKLQYNTSTTEAKL